jgi:hypothetical protein
MFVADLALIALVAVPEVTRMAVHSITIRGRCRVEIVLRIPRISLIIWSLIVGSMRIEGPLLPPRVAINLTKSIAIP